MIKPEKVPKGSATAVHELFEPGYLESIGLHPEAIVSAALNAWPGMTWACRGAGTPPHLLFLPLPQENSDDQ